MHSLILSAPFGNGHHRAAEATASALRDRGVRTTVVDVFSLVSPALGRVAAEAWTSLLKVAPSAYAAIYKWTESAATPGEHMVGSPWALRFFLGTALGRLIDELRPDLVATTHPAPLALAADLKRSGRTYRLLSINTDYTVHGFSVFPEVDGYCMPHHSLLPEMERRRVEPDRLFVTGIPVEPQFHRRSSRAEARRTLSLPEEGFIVAIMGGGLGMGPVTAVAKELTELRPPLVTLAFTGRNESLGESLRKLDGPGLQVIPYVDEISPYYDAIDLLITKPGGLTLAEAIAKHLPLALLPPLPGQEERNLAFLTGAEAALAVRPGELGEAIAFLRSHPERLTLLQNRVARLAVPEAAARVADASVRLMEVEHVSA